MAIGAIPHWVYVGGRISFYNVTFLPTDKKKLLIATEN